jgi:hypothetical protein
VHGGVLVVKNLILGVVLGEQQLGASVIAIMTPFHYNFGINMCMPVMFISALDMANK